MVKSLYELALEAMIISNQVRIGIDNKPIFPCEGKDRWQPLDKGRKIIKKSKYIRWMNPYYCRKAIGIYPYALINIPNKFKSRELCLKALKECGLTIRCIPSDMLTKEMCRVALLSSKDVRKHIPARFLD